MEKIFELKEETLSEELYIKKEEIENDESHILLDVYHYNSEIFSQINITSLFTTVFGFIEYELKKICNYHNKLSEINISMNDFKGNSEFEKSKNYLTKICKIDFNSLNPEWNYLLTAKEIRNILTHSQGEFVQNNDRKSKKIIQFIHKREYLDFIPNEEFGNEEDSLYSLDGKIIFKSAEISKELIDNAEIFFNKLLKNNLKYYS